MPPAIGGAEILSISGKLTARPFAAGIGRFLVRPMTLGLQATYTFGDRYFIRPPSRFPGKYYDFPTAIRAAVTAGSAAEVLVGDRRVGAYVELVALDVMLRAWADNPRTIGPREVLSLAIGVRATL